VATSSSKDFYKNHLGYSLECQLHLPENTTHPVPVLAGIHGFGGTMDSFYIEVAKEKALAAGLGFFRFNMSPVIHRNNSTYVNTRELTPHYAVKTIDCAFKYLKENPLVDADNIAATASSLGSYAGAYYAAHANGLKGRILEDPIKLKGLVLNVPVPDPLRPFENDIKKNGWLWKLLGTVKRPIAGTVQDISYKMLRQCRETNMFTDIAPHITCPVMIIHGDHDPYATPEEVVRFKDNMTQSSCVKHHMIDNVGHALENIDFMTQLSAMPLDQLTQIVKGARKGDGHSGLMAKYVVENCRSVTAVDHAVDVAHHFLMEEVFTDAPPIVDMGSTSGCHLKIA
jgi:pimeloyl-ACP methyl ester carboxylesterase